MVRVHLSLRDRGRALVLLSKGHSVDAAVNVLLKRAKHAGHTFDEVKRAYFPKCGLYSIQASRGASRAEISERYARLLKNAKEQTARAGEFFTEYMSDPEKRNWASERMRGLQKDPAFIEKRNRGSAVASKNPAKRRKQSETMKRKFAEDLDFRAKNLAWTTSDEFRELQSKNLLEKRKDPEFMRKLEEGRMALWADPEFLNGRSEWMRKLNNDPEIRAKMQQTRLTPEGSAKRSAITRKLWKDSSFRKKMVELARTANADPNSPLNVGRRNFVDNRRKEKAIALGFEDGWIIDPQGKSAKSPITRVDFEDIVHATMIAEKIHSALKILSPVEQCVTAKMFGLELDEAPSKSVISQVETMGADEVQTHLSTAFEKLRKISELKDLLAE